MGRLIPRPPVHLLAGVDESGHAGANLEKLALFTPRSATGALARSYSDVEVVPGDVLASVRSVERADNLLAEQADQAGGPRRG